VKSVEKGLIFLKAAAVDIGTNSCRLLIAEKKSSDDNLNILARELRITRIGEGVDEKGVLNPKAVKRVVKTLKEYRGILEDYNTSKFRLIATSALRDVKNAEILEKEVEKLGFDLEIISGRKEAELNYLGAVEKLEKNFMLIDIGGGSTEFIWPEKGEISFKSLDIGCVRLTEKFIENPEAALKRDEELKMRNYVNQFLNAELNFRGHFLLKGVGGTITTAAALKNSIEEYDSKKIEGEVIHLKEIENMLDKFKIFNLKQRSSLKGLQPKRADIISAGFIIFIEILNYIGSDNLTVSDHDLLYGLIQEQLNS